MSIDVPAQAGDSPAGRIFENLALALAEGQGDLEKVIALHPGHAGELRSLFEGWQRVDSLFRELAEGSAERAFGAVLSPEAEAEELRSMASRIGAARDFAARYERLGELGRGGMGVVWRVRDRLLGREVALKVVRERAKGSGRARLLRRFIAEAELTGGLHHPAIVSIHDLGIDDEGRVYFTMPLVQGRTLSEASALLRARDPAWTLSGVLEVLLKVCDAVAYAHSRGVLHRDLKPANVLVGQFGEVYVLDWGLARAKGAPTDPPGAGTSESSGHAAGLTLDGDVVGTPGYMAPEQARGEAIDERADVYALGATLGACLGFWSPSAHTAGERVGEQAALGELRGARAELAAIARKATAGAPAERYARVAELAGDLRAFLDGRVVRAYESGAWAEARKYVRRHGALAATAAGALLAILTLLGLHAASVSRANVTLVSQQARTARVAGFLEDLLLTAQPDFSIVPDPRFSDLLATAGPRIASEFRDEPAEGALLAAAVADSYVGLGRPADAEPLLQLAFELSGEAWGPDDPRTIVAFGELARIAAASGDLAAAVAHYRSAETRLAALVSESDGRLWRLRRLRLAAEQNLDPALRNSPSVGLELEAGWDACRKAFGRGDAETLSWASELAAHLVRSGDLAAAESLLTELLAEAARSLAPHHTVQFLATAALCDLLGQQGRFAEAEALVRARLELLSSPGISDPLGALGIRNNLGVLLLEQGRWQEAVMELERVHAELQNRLDPDDANALALENNLGLALAHTGEHARAREHLESARAGRERVFGRDSLQAIQVRNNLALLLAFEEHWEEASSAFREVVEAYGRAGSAPLPRLKAQQSLGVSLRNLGRYEESLVELRAVLAEREELLGPAHRLVFDAHRAIAKTLGAAGDDRAARELAVDYRARLPESAAILPEVQAWLDDLVGSAAD